MSTGIITTFAGTGTAGNTGDNGAATSALLRYPCDVTTDASGVIITLLFYYTFYFSSYVGNLYIVDNHRIRKVTVSTGIITCIAGSTGPTGGFSGDGGAATSAKLNNPYGVAVDSAGTSSFIFLIAINPSYNKILGNVYIADFGNNHVRKVTVSTGIITSIAGSSTSGSYSGDNGPATSAALNYPNGVRTDSAGSCIYLHISVF